jgi:hypothetical protein
MAVWQMKGRVEDRLSPIIDKLKGGRDMLKRVNIAKYFLPLILLVCLMHTACFAASRKVDNSSIDLFRTNKAKFTKVVESLKDTSTDVYIERDDNGDTSSYKCQDGIDGAIIKTIHQELLDIFYKLNYRSIKKDSTGIWFTIDSGSNANQLEQIVFSIDGECPELESTGLSVTIDRNWYYFVTGSSTRVELTVKY